MRAILRTILVPTALLLPVAASASTDVTLLDRSYSRGAGMPVAEVTGFVAVQGTARMTVTHSGVSSAVVKVNGVTVFSPKDFGSAGVLEAAVRVDTSNELVVELRGKPGERLSVLIVQSQDTRPTIYYTSYYGQEIRRVTPDGSDTLVAPSPYGSCFGVTLSAARSELAMICGTDGFDRQIWVMAIDGTGAYRLADAFWSNHVSWLSDDTEIAFDVNYDGIHRIATSGGPAPLWISISQFGSWGKNSFRWPAIRWAADRTRFVANVGVAGAGGNEAIAGSIDFAAGTVSDLHRISPPSDGSWTRTTQCTTISPDGADVYYAWRDLAAGTMELRRTSFDGTHETTLWTRPANNSTGMNSLRLAPDGERLWFSWCKEGGCTIASTTLNGGDYEEYPTTVAAGWFDLN